MCRDWRDEINRKNNRIKREELHVEEFNV